MLAWINADAFSVSAVFAPILSAGLVDENIAHRLRCGTEICRRPLQLGSTAPPTFRAVSRVGSWHGKGRRQVLVVA